MPLDTRIALGVQPLQLADPLAREGQVQNILASQAQQRAAGMQQQSAQMQMDQAQRQLRQDEDYVTKMADAIGKNGGPPDMEQAARLMATNRNPDVSRQGVSMLQSLRRLAEAREAGIFGTPAPVIPNVGPTPGAMGSGTFGMDQNVPMFNQRNVPPLNLAAPAPAVNQLTPPPAAPVNQLAAAPQADAAKTLQTEYMKLSQFTDVPGVKERMDLIKEQYKALLNQRNTAFAPIDASKYTPASLKAFNLSGNQSDLVAVTKAEKTIGTVSPADFTAASLAKYAESNDFKDLVPAPKAFGAGVSGGSPMGKAPSGYRYTPTGDLEPIPGGPSAAGLTAKEIQKREAVLPQTTQSLKTVNNTMSIIGQTVDRLLANPEGINGITGLVFGILFPFIN